MSKQEPGQLPHTGETGRKAFCQPQSVSLCGKQTQIRHLTLPHRLILAPMCDITLKPFRLICKKNGAGLVFNQMVSAKALTLRDVKTFKMIEYDESERPIGMQVFGHEPGLLAEAARILEDHGADVVDLNLGCPAKKIVNDGGGSALLTQPGKLGMILRGMRQAIKGIFTVKIRAGWDEKNKNAVDVAKMAQAEGVDALAVHARTRAQGYSGMSDWNLIRLIKESVNIPVIGNGDVVRAADAREMMRITGCDAVMTGRGALARPWIFNDLLNECETTPSSTELKKLIALHYDHALSYYGRERGIKIMRKFLCAYTKGKKNGAQFRNEMVRLNDFVAIQKKIEEFFHAV